MTMNKYSWNRREKKIAGVCSTLGDALNVDPTLLRIGFVAALFLISWEVALLAYVATGLWLHFRRQDGERMLNRDRRSDYDRMADVGKGRPSIHALRNDLDVTDRRMMAIDDHLAKPNDALAREIEALREDKR